MHKPRYIWWASNGSGSIGAWRTRKDVEDAIKTGMGGLLRDDVKWVPEKHEVTLCPTCGKPAEKDLVEGLGECLSCDHVRGEVMDEMRHNEEREEE